MSDPRNEINPMHFPVLVAAAQGDETARNAVQDMLEEKELVARVFPYEVDEDWMFCSVTMYHAGKVKDRGSNWIELDQCSWVHLTGHLRTFAKNGLLGFKDGDRKPRTEFLGDGVVIYTHALCHAYRHRGKLPDESLDS